MSRDVSRGQRLVVLEKQLDLQQKDVVEMTGILRQEVGKMERDATKWRSYDALKALAKGFGVKPDEMESYLDGETELAAFLAMVRPTVERWRSGKNDDAAVQERIDRVLATLSRSEPVTPGTRVAFELYMRERGRSETDAQLIRAAGLLSRGLGTLLRDLGVPPPSGIHATTNR